LFCPVAPLKNKIRGLAIVGHFCHYPRPGHQISRGSDFEPIAWDYENTNSGNGWHLQLGDFNGDGKTDYLYMKPNDISYSGI
jgi:hypothetical protein